MRYKIKKLQNTEDIMNCQVCPINLYPWGGSYRPNAYGQLGLLPYARLYIHMWAEEAEPVTACLCDQEPVYLDSALEFFIKSEGKSLYYNFEVNSAGVLLAQQGTNKGERDMLSPALMSQISCQPVKNTTDWHVYLTLPLDILKIDISPGIHFNFYKIKESPGLTHFASYMPLKGEVPDFHQPECFACGKVE